MRALSMLLSPISFSHPILRFSCSDIARSLFKQTIASFLDNPPEMTRELILSTTSRLTEEGQKMMHGGYISVGLTSVQRKFIGKLCQELKNLDYQEISLKQFAQLVHFVRMVSTRLNIDIGTLKNIVVYQGLKRVDQWIKKGQSANLICIILQRICTLKVIIPFRTRTNFTAQCLNAIHKLPHQFLRRSLLYIKNEPVRTQPDRLLLLHILQTRRKSLAQWQLTMAAHYSNIFLADSAFMTPSIRKQIELVFVSLKNQIEMCNSRDIYYFAKSEFSSSQGFSDVMARLEQITFKQIRESPNQRPGLAILKMLRAVSRLRRLSPQHSRLVFSYLESIPIHKAEIDIISEIYFNGFFQHELKPFVTLAFTRLPLSFVLHISQDLIRKGEIMLIREESYQFYESNPPTCLQHALNLAVVLHKFSSSGISTPPQELLYTKIMAWFESLSDPKIFRQLILKCDNQFQIKFLHNHFSPLFLPSLLEQLKQKKNRKFLQLFASYFFKVGQINLVEEAFHTLKMQCKQESMLLQLLHYPFLNQDQFNLSELLLHHFTDCLETNSLTSMGNLIWKFLRSTKAILEERGAVSGRYCKQYERLLRKVLLKYIDEYAQITKDMREEIEHLMASALRRVNFVHMESYRGFLISLLSEERIVFGILLSSCLLEAILHYNRPVNPLFLQGSSLLSETEQILLKLKKGELTTLELPPNPQPEDLYIYLRSPKYAALFGSLQNILTAISRLGERHLQKVLLHINLGDSSESIVIGQAIAERLKNANLKKMDVLNLLERYKDQPEHLPISGKMLINLIMEHFTSNVGFYSPDDHIELINYGKKLKITNNSFKSVLLKHAQETYLTQQFIVIKQLLKRKN